MRVSIEVPSASLAAAFLAVNFNHPYSNWIDLLEMKEPPLWNAAPSTILGILKWTTDNDIPVEFRITVGAMQRGLAKFAQAMPGRFAPLLDPDRTDIDAPTADLMLQFVVHGEEKYG